MTKHKIICGYCHKEMEEENDIMVLWEYLKHINKCHTIQGKMLRVIDEMINNNE